jgi:hypothetical protein
MNTYSKYSESIRAWMDAHRDEFIADTGRLVAIRSVKGDPAPDAPFGTDVRRCLEEAMALCDERGMAVTNYDFYAASADLCPEKDEQISIFDGETVGRARLEVLEKTADSIRSRFGKYAIRRGLMLEDTTLSGFAPHEDHTVHPIALRTK